MAAQTVAFTTPRRTPDHRPYPSAVGVATGLNSLYVVLFLIGLSFRCFVGTNYPSGAVFVVIRPSFGSGSVCCLLSLLCSWLFCCVIVFSAAEAVTQFVALCCVVLMLTADCVVFPLVASTNAHYLAMEPRTGQFSFCVVSEIICGVFVPPLFCLSLI